MCSCSEHDASDARSGTRSRAVRVVAATIWYSGAVILLLKGGGLLLAAARIRPGEFWPWLAVAAAILIGGLKTEFVFEKACRKNLVRIGALGRPRIWHAFRPGFYVFLATMVLLGATLSRLAQDNYFWLLGIATLDLSIAIALLGSSRVFWQKRSEN